MSVRWGIIGVGDVVERKSGAALQQVPDSTVSAVMRRSGALAADFAARHNIDRWYDDAQELVDDDTVDAVYVATPPDSHAEHTIRAALAGKPVYVEKPMARTAMEADQMIAACEDAGLGLFVAYYRRALPRFVSAEQAVRAGEIGDVDRVEISLTRTDPGSGWRLDPSVAGGGLFMDLASHTLDWLDLVLGPVASVSAEVGGGPAESRVDADLRFAGGAIGRGHWDFTADEDRDEIRLIGSDGEISLSCFGSRAPVLRRGDRRTMLAAEQPSSVQYPLIANVVAALAGTAEPLSTGHTAVRTTRVIDQVLADHRARHGLEL